MEKFQIKTWRILTPSNITEADIVWLRKNCHNVQFDSGTDPIKLDYRGSQFSVNTRTPVLKFSTNNSKQETLLKIKFGDELILESWVNCAGTHAYV